MILHGKCVSPGFAEGKAYVVALEYSFERAFGVPPVLPPPQEFERYQNAAELACLELERVRHQLSEQGRPQDAAIFAAHAAMLGEDSLTHRVRNRIIFEGRSAEAAVAQVMQELRRTIRGSRMPLLRERDADISDIGQRLLRCLAPTAEWESVAQTVVVAESLTPSDFVRLVHDGVIAVITQTCGMKSHTAILARGFAVPFVTGIEDVTAKIPDGAAVVVDADSGTVIVEPTSEEATEIDRLRSKKATVQTGRAEAPLQVTSSDGVPVTVLLNVTDPSEAETVMSLGAGGIGLFRTEFLYMDRESWPTEQESYEVYRRVAEVLNRRAKDQPPVAKDGSPAGVAAGELHIRLADFGAEKCPPYADIPINRNPSLGVRGVRLLLKRDDILRPQVKAIARVAADFPVTVLLPMVDTVDTLLAIVERLCQICECKDRRTIPFRLGTMIEIPAAALAISEILSHVDAVSVGLNDLTQYLLAADRDDESVEAYHDPLQPPVLRLINQVIAACQSRDKPVTMCGELAGDATLAIVLLALGVRRFSVSRTSFPEIVQRIGSLRMSDVQQISSELLRLPTGKEVRSLIKQRFGRG